MSRVTTLVGPPHVHDICVRAVHLDLEGGNERVFGIDDCVL